MLTIDQTTYDGIVAHAKRDHPDEACGVVAGPEGSGRPERLVEMVNAAGSPTFYEFDSTDLFKLYREMDDRAIACFDRALDDVGVEPGSRLRDALHDYFAWATRTAMADHPRSRDDVPDGLSIPRWSWDGLVRT